MTGGNEMDVAFAKRVKKPNDRVATKAEHNFHPQLFEVLGQQVRRDSLRGSDRTAIGGGLAKSTLRQNKLSAVFKFDA